MRNDRDTPPQSYPKYSIALWDCTVCFTDKIIIRTCPPSFFEAAQCAFDGAPRSSLEHTVTASGFGFGDWQWRLAVLPFAFGGLGVYSAGDVCHYAFLASRLQSASLQTKLLRHAGIVSLGRAFEDALGLFTRTVESDILSNPSEVDAPKLMRKLEDMYFTKVTASAGSTPFFSHRQSALWKSQPGDHTSAWIRAVPISGVFAGNAFGDHAVSCAGILILNIGIILFGIPLLMFVIGLGFRERKRLILDCLEGTTDLSDLQMGTG
ncbi:hypothetical protein OROHE_001879 [Orobanche hederae]